MRKLSRIFVQARGIKMEKELYRELERRMNRLGTVNRYQDRVRETGRLVDFKPHDFIAAGYKLREKKNQ